jgi:transposase
MLQETDFAGLAKRELNGRRRIRLLALAHFKDGMNRAAIARVLKVSRGSVNKWVANFLQEGLSGLEGKSPPGRQSKLTPCQLKELAAYIEQSSQSDTGGRLQAFDVQQFLSDKFSVTYQPSNVYRLMHELGFSWITSRSKHPKQSKQAQDEFKKIPN